MKVIILVMFACIGAIHTSVVPETKDYASLLVDVIGKANELELFKEQLMNNYSERELYANAEVDEFLARIEKLKFDHDNCVQPAQNDISNILKTLFDENETCIAVSYASAGEIVKDIAIVTTQILTDAYKLAQLFKQCQREADSVKQGICFTRFSLKLVSSITDLVATIKHMIDNRLLRVQEVIVTEDTCKLTANDKAMEELQTVRKQIDTCIVN